MLAEPLRCRGPVIHGFKRGSKELGIPTANLDVDLLGPDVQSANTGVYFGWASVGTDPTVYKFVMSIGWNPFYKNEKKTVEPHLLHDFGADGDFYGSELRLVTVGYLRQEASFPSLEALVAAIHADIAAARAALDEPAPAALAADPYLVPPETSRAS